MPYDSLPQVRQTVRTLRDLADRIESDPLLSATFRRDLVSAIRTGCRWLGQPPEAVAADAHYLRQRLAELHPALLRVSQKRIDNVVSALRAALRAAQFQAPRGREGLALEWRKLLDLLSRAYRWRLSSFARFCSARGISPTEVTTDTFGEFLKSLETSLAKYPRATVRMAALCWTEAVRTIPTWPKRPIQPPSFAPAPTTIDLALFPASFQEDYRRCGEHLRSKDPFLGDEGVPPLAPSTAEVSTRFLKYAASVLVRRGRAIETIQRVADVVDPLAAREVLTHYFQKAGNRRTLFTATMARTLKSIARRYVGVDEAMLALHSENVGKMTPEHRGLTEKNMKRLRQFSDERCKLLLLDSPETLMKRALRHEKITSERAIDLMSAAAIAILLFAPIRLANLAAIELGRHLRLPSRKNEPAYLHFDKDEVKNQIELDFELPPTAVQVIATYLERGRPRLMDAADPHLFYKQSQKLRASYLSRWISQRLRDATGLKINAHLFRHIAAKLYLDQNPGDYETVRILLGHQDIRTTVTFYCGLERDAAIRHYDQEVLKLHTRLKDGPAGKRAPRKTRRREPSASTNDERPRSADL